MRRADFEPRGGQRPDQFRAGAKDSGTQQGPETRTVSFDGRKLPWMNGQIVSVDLGVIQANGKTLLTGSIESTYPGVGGLTPDEITQARAAYGRLTEAVLQMGSVKADDCLTTRKKGDPSVLVIMVGHNARRRSIFVYAVDTRLENDRMFAFVGGSAGEQRGSFEKGFRRARYESNKGQGRSFR